MRMFSSEERVIKMLRIVPANRFRVINKSRILFGLKYNIDLYRFKRLVLNQL